MINVDFESIEAIKEVFPDETSCINHLEQLRWPGGIWSPFDDNSKVYRCAGGKYRCKSTGRYFTVRTNTIFDGTRIPLQKWFFAIFLLSENDITSVELAEKLSLTQKTAWLLRKRIIDCYGNPVVNRLINNCFK